MVDGKGVEPFRPAYLAVTVYKAALHPMQPSTETGTPARTQTAIASSED